METKYLNKLEFDKVLNILSNFATTYIGKELALNLIPSNDKEMVKQLQNETSEAYSLIYRNGNLPIDAIPNILPHLKMLDSNCILSIKYLLDIANILKISREFQEYFSSSMQITENKSSILYKYFSKIYSNYNIENQIFSAILDENALNDNASTSLASIRRNIRKTEQQIRDKLNSYLSSKYLQERLVTIKNNRFVVPVKSEYRSEIKGFIHGTSSTGSTLFIEPMNVFELNNSLAVLHIEEEREIERILQRLSNLLYDITENLKININMIGKLDLIFAKAKYAISIDATEPIINSEKYVNLIKVRHPLISSDTVVPIDINIGKTFQVLLITGSNTGGKTVTLKTFGLICAMAMCGLYIPAKEGSSVYVFDNIFADIGDEQSILASLSTFSSHMVNIIEILNSVTSNSLVLLDEIGSGTDPIEGANLGISILNYLYNNKVLVLSTTHYPELKNYALVTDGYENASSEFDIENLRPTYKLLIGIPGQSNAFAICKQLGINSKILDYAKSLMNMDVIHIEDLLKSIYDNKLKIEEEKEKILKESTEIAKLRKSLERDNTALIEQEKEIINNAKLQARDILLSAKEKSDFIIRELNKIETSSKSANNLRNDINNTIKNLDIQTYKNIPNEITKLDINEIKLNMTVFIPSINQIGTILSFPNKDKIVQVQVGNTKIYFSIDKLEKTNKVASNISSIYSSEIKNTTKSQNLSNEINVIGLNVEEAIQIIDKYLDSCSMANLKKVRIVHGKGTGKLREGIHKYLKTNSYVKNFRVGAFGEGEMGVTIVELK